MPPELPSAVLRRETFGLVFRTIRLHRRLRTADVAAAMGMPHRSYQHIEAGRGRADLAYFIRFAEATDCDLYALVAAVLLDAPELAVRCADNKLVHIVTTGLAEAAGAWGGATTTLRGTAILSATDRLTARLTADLSPRTPPSSTAGADCLPVAGVKDKPPP